MSTIKKQIVVALTLAVAAFCLEATPVLDVSRCSANDTPYITTRSTANITGSKQFTIECWVKQPSFDGENAILNLDGGDGRLFFQTQNGKLFLKIGAATVLGKGSLSAGMWHHVAASHASDGTTSFYIDGELDSSQFHTTDAVQNTKEDGFTLGALPRASASGAFRGRIAELRVWKTARSAAEIAANRSLRLRGTESGLYAYWPMNEGEGAEIWDCASGIFGKIAGTDYVKWVEDADFPIADQPCAASDTVGLWPLSWRTADGAFDGRSARFGLGNDLRLDAGMLETTQAAAWILPPNPDASVDEALAANAELVPQKTSADNSTRAAYSQALGSLMTPDRAFTLEGWIKFKTLPSAGGFAAIVAVCHGDNNNRILASLWNASGSYKLSFYSYHLTGGSDVFGRTFTADEVAALTTDFHHYALVHNPDENGQAVSRVYWDGECVLESAAAKSAAVLHGVLQNANLDIGGRLGSGCSHAAYDYWRLSRAALAPSQFLNAGGSAAAVRRSATRHYWKLDGASVGAPAVGAESLNGGVSCEPTGSATPSPMSLSRDHAPTASWIPNNGSLLSSDPLSYVSAANAGNSLKLTGSWTLEGYFRPIRRGGEAGVQLLLSTHVGGNGMRLEFRKSGNGWYLTLFAHDGEKEVLPRTAMSGDLAARDDWMHVAVTYAASEGRGTWRVYVDGTLSGSAENTVAVATAYKSDPDLYIGGRPSNAEAFIGNIDSIRVSEGCLAADRFLCGANGEQASGVVAFWPLDLAGDMHFNGRDIVGNGHLSPAGCDYVSIVKDAPTIGNPDRATSFRGAAGILDGSCSFAGNAGSYACMGTFGASNFLYDKAPYTLEGYFKHTEAQDRKEVLFAGMSGMSLGSTGTERFSLFLQNGRFKLLEGLWDKAQGIYSFPVDVALVDDAWTHVALTRRFADSKVIYELFLDGVSKGTKELEVVATPRWAGSFCVGGCPASEWAFAGRISSVRVTSEVLAATEFLCAEKPVKPQTAAFDQESVRPGTVLRNYSELMPPFGTCTLEVNFAWTGDDGVVAATPTWEMAVRDGRLVVSGTAGGDTTHFLDIAADGALRRDEPTWYALVFRKDGVSQLYVERKMVAEDRPAYAVGTGSMSLGDLTLGSAATGEMPRVRITSAALNRRSLLHAKTGVCVIIR